jgi:hypothetical protein
MSKKGIFGIFGQEQRFIYDKTNSGSIYSTNNMQANCQIWGDDPNF